MTEVIGLAAQQSCGVEHICVIMDSLVVVVAITMWEGISQVIIPFPVRSNIK